MASIRGIDVSKHNGYINWEKVKDDGVKFVIIRAGFGSSTIDERFEEYIKGAIKENIDVGIYWFSYAISEEKAKLEAIKCMEVIKPYKDKIVYPVFYDFEQDSVRYAKEKGVNINKTKATGFAYAFLKQIQKGGYLPGLYTNINFSNNYYSNNIQREYDIWIAQYNLRTTYSEPYVMWQYSDSGRISGISGDVDLNYCYKKYKNEKKDQNDSTTDSNKDENKKNDITKSLVKSLQNALNKSYDYNLVEDGILGTKTKEIIKKHPLSIKNLNKKSEHTEWLQKSLKELGYDIIVDGYFGNDTKSIVEKYQKNKNLKVDKIAGIETHKSIISHIQ